MMPMQAFAAALPNQATLDQWSDVSNAWQGGSLNDGNSNYSEGEVVPYRLNLSHNQIQQNVSYTVSVCRDYSNGTIRGFLNLATFNTDRAATAGGTITSTSGAVQGVNVTIEAVTEVGAQGTCGAGQRETILTVKKTAATAYVLWGGYLAATSDVGAGNGASEWPGASLHMNAGNEDRSLQSSSIIVVDPVLGCTDPDANNYNSLATQDDGSCTYDPDVVLGCTDPDATNYNPAATQDDGSCIPKVLGCTDPDANNYDADANTNDGSCTYDVLGCTNPAADNYNPAANVDDGSCIVPVTGCTNPDALNYNPDATEDDGSCILEVLGCTNPDANNYDPAANTNDGSCTFDILGCTDPDASNYDAAANMDDGSCTYDPDVVLGCTDPDANNYNPAATQDDQSCTYDPDVVLGCTDPDALNYNPDATSGNPDAENCSYDNDTDPDLCTVTIVSDTSDFVVEKGTNAVPVTFIHGAWTAVLGAASWIWGDDPVALATGDVTQTFRKQFGFVGTVTNATLEVASDNNHSAVLNGSASHDGISSFGGAVSYNVTSEVLQGNNELNIAVTNLGAVNDTTSNPAGLKYRLTIEGEVTTDADCAVPYVPPREEPDELSCTITASDTSIRRGRDVTLNWSSVGADAAELDGTGTTTSGSLFVENLRSDTTYTLTVFGDYIGESQEREEATCSVTIDTRSGGGGGNNNDDDDRDGEVLGDSDDRPEGEVLGEQVDAVPLGAADTGAGGTSRGLEFFHVVPVALLRRKA
jgi:hypothetical protein